MGTRAMGVASSGPAPMMMGVRRGRGVSVGGYVGEAASAVMVWTTAKLVARVLGVGTAAA